MEKQTELSEQQKQTYFQRLQEQSFAEKVARKVGSLECELLKAEVKIESYEMTITHLNELLEAEKAKNAALLAENEQPAEDADDRKRKNKQSGRE